MNNARTRLPPIRRAIQILRQEGLTSFVFHILSKTIYRRVILFERLLHDPIPDLVPRLRAETGLLEKTQVEEYIGFRPEADPSEIHNRLQQGQWCFVARCEGKIIYALWSATGQARIDYLSREIKLAPDQVYWFAGFTSPAYRGKNIHSAQLAAAARYFRDAGYHRVTAITVPEDKAAVRCVEKNGFHPIGVMGYFKLGPWRHDFCHMWQV